ncbi:GNAT family N-acetyltransferase [Prochlorococcus marinus]|uniref:Butyryltransferase n=1 Tax=Prochlorococcus marinus str. PAC1 TaxID=59924 RepID=A0A0A2C365_PROMR|nr:GNAT family N-acetyltransferase [Prochlorococcus marinus]KGG20801.1 Butyryltransferase [Prochlorococcus marinus str. PAC1]
MRLNSKKLFFRSAAIEDSDFIYKLRSSKGQFINNQGFTKKVNQDWISQCSQREKDGKEFYFIISDSNKDVGVVRIYKINYEEKTFAWGSWILIDGCSPLYAIISAVMVYTFAFEYLGMKKSFFDVRNDNFKVKSFHEKTGAKFLKNDELDTFYSFDEVGYKNLRDKYRKYTGEIQW